jgi:hypothetical protein
MWYLLIRAARYLHVPPWELEQMPAEWIHKALMAEGVENEVEARLLKEASKKHA